VDGATRHRARERALSLLYEAEMKGIPPTEVVAELPVAPDAFTTDLVGASERHRPEADERIARASTSWPLDRMAVVDRLVLRLAVSELLEPDGPPTAVVIDEAVELAKTYSTDDSGAFVNGILSAVSSELLDTPSARRRGAQRTGDARADGAPDDTPDDRDRGEDEPA
jgi:transcription antitermination protein NusB